MTTTTTRKDAATAAVPLRCPTCWALTGERCQTKDGRPTSHHTGHPKVAVCDSWGCGAKLGEPCRTHKGNLTKKPHARNAEAIGRSGAAAWASSQAYEARRRTFERAASSADAFRDFHERVAQALGGDLGASWRALEGTRGGALRELGLDIGATPQDVAQAFRRRAMGTHPDHGGDPEAFKQLVRARDAALAAIEGA